METLTRDQEQATTAPVEAEAAAPVTAPVAEGAAPDGAEPQVADPAPEQVCGTCAATMAAGQDWCLECGTAAPGRLGGRPGWRAVGTTLALTVLLVGGAGAASYAALSSDATRQAATGATADGTPVAQVPPIVPAPPAPVTSTPAAGGAPTATPPGSPAAAVTPPATKLPAAPKVTGPATSPPGHPLLNPFKIPKQKSSTSSTTTKTQSSKTPTSTSKDTTTAGGTGTTTESGAKTTATATLTPLAFAADAVSLYDPYTRAKDAGDPAAIGDDDAATTFSVGAPADGKPMQVGIVVDLGTVKQVRGLRFTTPTKGVGVEVYAADGSALPPDILDTRWDHVASRSNFDGKQIVFARGGSQYRYVTLWFTKAPKAGPKVSVEGLKLLR